MKTSECRADRLTTGLVGVVLCAAATAAAGDPAATGPQRNSPVAAADQTGSGDTNSLQTVVVTSERRAENLQEVPASITAISAAEIEGQHLENLEDIARIVPGLSLSSGGNPGMNTITLRGISSQGGNATVGEYLDDVPITTQSSYAPPSPTSGAADPKLFDLERVEVLRGPQGTLYGASSMGGAVRFITRAPEMSQFSGSLTSDLSYTRDGALNYEETGILNVPIVSGVLAVRGGVDVGELSGYIDRYAQIPLTQADVNAGNYEALRGGLLNSNVNTQRTIAGRLTAEWLPFEGLKVTPAIFAQRFNAGDTSVFYPWIGLNQQNKLVPEPSRDTLFVPSLTIQADLRWSDFTSVSSFFSRQNAHTNDGTFFNSTFIQFLADTSADLGPCNCGVAFANLGSPSYSHEQTHTITQEFRLASKLPGQSGVPLSWVAGLYASDRKIKTDEYDYIPGIRQTFLTLYGLPPEDTSFGDPFTNDLAGWNRGHEDQKQYAFFGELTYYITPQLKLTGGARTLHAETSFVWDNAGYFAQGIAPHTEASVSYNATTPKASISYDVTSDATVYATAAKGYRIGGFIVPIDLTTGTCPASLAAFGITNPRFSYSPDSLWSYETGAKTTWADNRLSVNGAAYYVDWKDVQQTFSLACGSQYTANFGTAESYGGELEILGKPLRGLTLGIEASAVHATLTKVVPNVGASVGQHLLNTPEWTATLNGEYQWPVFASTSLFLRTDYDMIGRSNGSFNVSDPAYNRPSYTLLNASAGLRQGSWSASLYARNLLNDHKIIQQVPIELLETAYTPRPLTVGVQVSARF
jgi:iron complex outermembrane recepter protein